MQIISLKEQYHKKSIPLLQKAVGSSNIMALPRINYVVVNVGIGRFLKDSSKVDAVYKSVSELTGQKPVYIKARKAIAGFKLREGMDVAIKVTLRQRRAWDFLDRLVNATIPRIRDFRGLKSSSVDQNGNLNIGIAEHVVFPEITSESSQILFGLQVTVVSTAKNQEDGYVLFKSLGFPLVVK